MSTRRTPRRAFFPLYALGAPGAVGHFPSLLGHRSRSLARRYLQVRLKQTCVRRGGGSGEPVRIHTQRQRAGSKITDSVENIYALCALCLPFRTPEWSRHPLEMCSIPTSWGRTGLASKQQHPFGKLEHTRKLLWGRV